MVRGCIIPTPKEPNRQHTSIRSVDNHPHPISNCCLQPGRTNPIRHPVSLGSSEPILRQCSIDDSRAVSGSISSSSQTPPSHRPHPNPLQHALPPPTLPPVPPPPRHQHRRLVRPRLANLPHPHDGPHRRRRHPHQFPHRRRDIRAEPTYRRRRHRHHRGVYSRGWGRIGWS